MSAWNYDMSTAPRGRVEKREQKGPKGTTITREHFIPDLIIAAARDGVTVTATYWMRKEGRWHMFATGEEPLCWQPWPTHPEAAE